MKGILSSILGLFLPPDKDSGENIRIDSDRDGKPLFRDDVARYVLDELDRRKQERLPLENQWRLNSNFLAGNQYCDINVYSGGVEQLRPVYSWLEREAFNRISPLIETRIANLKRIKYLMTVKPRTSEIDDYEKAEVATAILRHKQNTGDFEELKNTLIAWNELCGSAFWLSWWNRDSGEEILRETVHVDDGENPPYEREIVYREGDVDYGLLTPYEIYPESIFKQSVENQRSIIVEQIKSVDEIYDLYGVKVEGASLQTFTLTPVPFTAGFGLESTVNVIGHREVKDSERVITYFERGSRAYPDGRLVIIIGDRLYCYGALPYTRIPVVQVKCRETPGQFFGKSVIEELIPLQRAYNGCVNRIHEFIKQVALNGFITEEGAVDVEYYEENGLPPAAWLVYKTGTQPPRPIPNGQIPQEILNEREIIKRDMEYTAAVSQLMAIGSTPSGVTSGVAIENLKEIDSTRLSLTGDHIRNSVKAMAKIWLEIYKKYAATSRTVKYTGANDIGKAIVWSNEDITSFDIVFDTINELELSEEMQRQRFIEAYQLGLFTDENGQIPQRTKNIALEMMKIGNYTGIMNLNQLQIQAAQNENAFFENGVIPEVSELDDHGIHMDEHLRYMLQMRFRILKTRKPEYAERLIDHYRQHKELAQNAGMVRQLS